MEIMLHDAESRIGVGCNEGHSTLLMLYSFTASVDDCSTVAIA